MDNEMTIFYFLKLTAAVAAPVVTICGLIFRWWLKGIIDERFKKEAERRDYEYSLLKMNMQAGIESGQKDISDLRTMAITGAGARSLELHKNRSEAAKVLWSEVTKLQAGQNLVSLWSTLHYEQMLDMAVNKPDAAELGKVMRAGFTWDSTFPGPAESTRLFVSESTWASFLALRSIVFFAYFLNESFEKRLGSIEGITTKLIDNMIRIELPDFSATKAGRLDHGAAMPLIIDKILRELRSTLKGEDENLGDVEAARQVIALAAQHAKELDSPREGTLPPV